ncbi:MAG TPA: TlpA disulfide reductase family protein [Baekduia sp.]|nr:TlpA disulfide reductase family protein [Baekduia sp.]
MSRRLLMVLGVLAVVAVLVIGLTQAGSSSDKPDQTTMSLAEQRQQLAGAPPELAALHAQASQLLDGAPKAFEARLRALRGTPVVVNKWGSWCGPCRLEFPVFQRVAVALGKRVAFVGLDGKDPIGSAKAFLRKVPLSYPSYIDGDEAAARSIDAGAFYPTTVFIDPRGRRTVHQGPYDSDAALKRDIERYALDQGA